jgi:hypothetical protein
MFPVSDFNFVVAGIATFAATVGYACSRRLSGTLYVLPKRSSRTALTSKHRSEPNAGILRQILKNEEALSAEKTSIEKSANDILVDEEPTVYAFLNSETENQSRCPDPTTSILVRHESLKRKVPHDGFDEPSKVHFIVVLYIGSQANRILGRTWLSSCELIHRIGVS